MIPALIVLSTILALAVAGLAAWAWLTREPAELRFPAWEQNVLHALQADVYARFEELVPA